MSASLCFSNENLGLDCLKGSGIYQSPKEDASRVLHFDVRGKWERISKVKNLKLSACDKKVINFLIKSERHFLESESKEFDCKRSNSKIVCEEILIDECCILKWREEEIKNWEQLK